MRWEFIPMMVLVAWAMLKILLSMAAYREALDRYFELIQGGLSKTSAEQHPAYLRALKRAEATDQSRNKAIKIAIPIIVLIAVLSIIFRK